MDKSIETYIEGIEHLEKRITNRENAGDSGQQAPENNK